MQLNVYNFTIVFIQIEAKYEMKSRHLKYIAFGINAKGLS